MAASKILFFSFFIFIFYINAPAQQNNFSVIAYYAGGQEQVDSFPIEKLTHIIFSFSHLKGNQLHINIARDTATIEKLVSLKNRNPNLKVILSLGGWGGCASCSDVFSSKSGRKEFAKSVKKLSQYFHTDGIDLDWEYPAIEGFPSHKYQPADKQNFTSLTLTDIMLQKYIGDFGWNLIESWSDMRRYHYFDFDPATQQQVYRNYIIGNTVPTYSSNNQGPKPAYRYRPTNFSEFDWNFEELRKLGATNIDYHTYEMWFSKP